jgi:hypothetical protein
MSVAIAVLKAQEEPIGGFENVIGYVIAAVVKHEDGAVTLERGIAVTADNFEDNQLAEATVKKIEAKLNEAFPDRNKPKPSKLWVPN